MSAFAKKEFGVEQNCNINSKLNLTPDGKSVFCDTSGYTGVLITPPKVSTDSKSCLISKNIPSAVVDDMVACQNGPCTTDPARSAAMSQYSTSASGCYSGYSGTGTTTSGGDRLAQFEKWASCYVGKTGDSNFPAPIRAAIVGNYSYTINYSGNSNPTAISDCEKQVGLTSLSSLTGGGTSTGYPDYSGGEYTGSDQYCKEHASKFTSGKSGCHEMSNDSSKFIWTRLNGPMNEYVAQPVGGGAVSWYSCSSNPITNCATSYTGTGTTYADSSSCANTDRPYWTGWSCVTTSDCTSGGGVINTSVVPSRCDYSSAGTSNTNTQASCTSYGGTWNATSNYCVYPNYTGGTGTYSDQCSSSAVVAILGTGAHTMNGNFCFNSSMTQYLSTPSDTIIKDCATSPVSGCSSFSTSLSRPSLLSSLVSLFLR